MSYCKARPSYGELRNAFHSWARAEKKEFNIASFVLFRQSLPSCELNGIPVPRDLSVYGMYRKKKNFFEIPNEYVRERDGGSCIRRRRRPKSFRKKERSSDYGGQVCCDVLDISNRGGPAVCYDCLTVIGLPSLEAMKKACREERRSDLYIVLPHSIYYSLAVFCKFIAENNIRTEQEFINCRNNIKKEKVRPFYPENTMEVYKKKIREIIAGVFSKAA